MRVLANVGDDRSFGSRSHDETEVKPFEKSSVDGKTVWLVTGETTKSANGSVEAYEDTETRVTYCFAPTDTAAGSCPLTLTTDVHNKLSAMFDLATAGADTKKDLADIPIVVPYDRTAQVTYVIEKGVVKAKLVKGAATDLPAGTVGDHKLF